MVVTGGGGCWEVEGGVERRWKGEGVGRRKWKRRGSHVRAAANYRLHY